MRATLPSFWLVMGTIACLAVAPSGASGESFESYTLACDGDSTHFGRHRAVQSVSGNPETASATKLDRRFSGGTGTGWFQPRGGTETGQAYTLGGACQLSRSNARTKAQQFCSRSSVSDCFLCRSWDEGRSPNRKIYECRATWSCE